LFIKIIILNLLIIIRIHLSFVTTSNPLGSWLLNYFNF